MTTSSSLLGLKVHLHGQMFPSNSHKTLPVYMFQAQT